MAALSDINRMTPSEFVAQFGDIAEHSPWVAERALAARPWGDLTALVAAFHDAVDGAREREQLALLRAHPDLATKAALTPDSASEQAGAGLDSLSAEEFARFTDLNDRYKTRFGFPFIFAVKGATKHQILESFDARVDNDAATELETALTMVKRIIGFRLNDRLVG